MGALLLLPLECHPDELELEIELRHGIGEWDILHEGFIMMFNFKDEFDYIDEVLQ